jgi:hypothetical protein
MPPNVRHRAMSDNFDAYLLVFSTELRTWIEAVIAGEPMASVLEAGLRLYLVGW